MYTVQISRKAAKSLAKLDKKTQRGIAKIIDDLAAEPRPDGCKKLKNPDDIYSIRKGDYRITYQVKDKILLILVLAVGHRSDIYRRL